jgi:hypothetical protein
MRVYGAHLIWGGALDEVRTWIMNQPENFHIPSLFI